MPGIFCQFKKSSYLLKNWASACSSIVQLLTRQIKNKEQKLLQCKENQTGREEADICKNNEHC